MTSTFKHYFYLISNMKFKKIQAIIDNIFLSEFPQIIEIAYNDPNPDRVLIWAYTRVRDTFQQNRGSAAGYQGIYEYLYLQYVKKYLEEKLKRVVKSECKDPVYFFQCVFNDSVITFFSDVEVGEKTRIKIATKKFRPDIYIGIQKGENIIPLAFFEIKSSITGKKVMDTVIEKFKRLDADFEAVSPLLILLHIHVKKDEYSDKYETLTKLPNFYFMRFNWNKWNSETIEGDIEGTPINAILDLIIEKIKRF